MTVCMTTPVDAAQIPAILTTQGWIELGAEEVAKAQVTIDVAILAQQYWLSDPSGGMPSGGIHVLPEGWIEGWKSQQDSPYVQDEDETVLGHAKTGAILVFANTPTRLALNFRCLLAVPKAVLKGSSYFPRLSAPPNPALSHVILDDMSSDAIKTISFILSASLDPEGISEVLNISTDVGAVFFSSVKYPRTAVTP